MQSLLSTRTDSPGDCVAVQVTVGVTESMLKKPTGGTVRMKRPLSMTPPSAESSSSLRKETPGSVQNRSTG